MDGYKAADLLESDHGAIPRLLRKLQKSHDTFEEDWNSAWHKYEEAQEQLLKLKEHLEKMKQRYEAGQVKDTPEGGHRE